MLDCDWQVITLFHHHCLSWMSKVQYQLSNLPSLVFDPSRAVDDLLTNSHHNTQRHGCKTADGQNPAPPGALKTPTKFDDTPSGAGSKPSISNMNKKQSLAKNFRSSHFHF